MSFTDSEGLRILLRRLQQDHGARWRRDPEAAALMDYAAHRYAALARKHGLDPWEAAAAAFDAMRAPSTPKARDPWAVITRAVQVTCIAEERARGLLCSVHQARRPRYSHYHDAERFSDRETPLADYHPALRAPHPAEDEETSPLIAHAVSDAVTLLVLLGWPADTARAGVELICTRLSESGSRGSAYDALRRDHSAQALLDLPQPAWTTLLRALLGAPDPAVRMTRAGRGALLRLLVGEPLATLLNDESLRVGLVEHAPGARP